MQGIESPDDGIGFFPFKSSKSFGSMQPLPSLIEPWNVSWNVLANYGKWQI